MTAFNSLTQLHLVLVILGPFQTSCHQTLSVNVGESVTLRCKCQDKNIVMCFWFKQALGRKPVQISSHFKHNSKGDLSNIFESNQRFSLNNTNNDNHLEIKNLQISDAATYFCMSSNMYNLDFLEGITLNIEGTGFAFSILVHESISESSKLGDFRALKCSFENGICDVPHRVDWFQKSKESAAGVLYTHGSSSDQCERNTASQTSSCVYNLPIHNETVNVDGTHCAVASCGKVLFANKYNLESEDKDKPSIFVYVLSGVLALTVILIMSLTLSIYKIINVKSPLIVTTENEDSIHYAALHHHKSNRPRRQADSTTSECVYSSVQL